MLQADTSVPSRQAHQRGDYIWIQHLNRIAGLKQLDAFHHIFQLRLTPHIIFLHIYRAVRRAEYSRSSAHLDIILSVTSPYYETFRDKLKCLAHIVLFKMYNFSFYIKAIFPKDIQCSLALEKYSLLFHCLNSQAPRSFCLFASRRADLYGNMESIMRWHEAAGAEMRSLII